MDLRREMIGWASLLSWRQERRGAASRWLCGSHTRKGSCALTSILDHQHLGWDGRQTLVALTVAPSSPCLGWSLPPFIFAPRTQSRFCDARPAPPAHTEVSPTVTPECYTFRVTVGSILGFCDAASTE